MIRKAEFEDFESVMDIYKTAREYMKNSGNPTQWGEDYPEPDLIKADIEKQQLFVCVEEGLIHGAFALIIGEDPTYAEMVQGAWKNQDRYGAIHRVASDGAVRGLFHQCVQFCKTRISNLKIDTHEDNKTMQHVIEKEGFEVCGIITAEDKTPRIAYQFSET